LNEEERGLIPRATKVAFGEPPKLLGDVLGDR
jgi:hypothetical protein